VLETFRAPVPPNLPGMHPALWRLLRGPLGLQLHLTTVALLPPLLRERFGLRQTRADTAAFHALAATARASGPLMAGPLREFGPSYVRWRRSALTRGDVASRAPDRRARRPEAA
jgi:uncharacterized protein (DUF2236 family)